MKYDLRHEPWIPVLTTTGTQKNVSIIEALRDAADIRFIATETATQRFALHRFLLAIIHRALKGPTTLTDWKLVRDEWQQLQAHIEIYLEEWSHKFDLLHPETPFMQIADLTTSKGDTFSVERLLMDVPNGSKLFTMRQNKGMDELTYAEAALWLINSQAFDESGIKSGAIGDSRVKAGKGSPIGTGWAGNLQGIQAIGENLKATLLLNLVVPGMAGTNWATDHYAAEDDLPSWERDLTAAPRKPNPENYTENYATGFIDLYTWQARRIRLINSGTGISSVLICNGDKILPQNTYSQEPQSFFRYSEPQTTKAKTTVYMPGTMEPAKQVWRGIESLLATTITSRKTTLPPVRPAIYEFIGTLRAHELIADSGNVKFSIVSVEYGPQNSGYVNTYGDFLEIPSFLADSASSAQQQIILNNLKKADDVAFFLGIYADELSHAGGNRDSEEARVAIKNMFYSELDLPVRQWISDLVVTSDWEVKQSEIEHQFLDLATMLANSYQENATTAALAGSMKSDGTWVSAGAAYSKLQTLLRKTLDHLNLQKV